MLKGTRDAVLKKIQPISIHGQMSWEIVFTHLDDPEEPLRAARVGPEAIEASTLDVGDRVRLEYLVGIEVQAVNVGGMAARDVLASEKAAVG